MVKSGHKRPTNDCEDKGPVENGGAAVHWANCVNDKIVKSNPNWAAAIKFGGGSDSGEFIYIAKVNGKVSYVGKNKLHAGDVVFEIQNIKVSGFTSNDVIVLLNECFKSTSVIFKCVPGNFIPISLRQFLNLRFPKGSIDHALQNTIRDNLYLRTVPVTTRKRRDKETDGVDYKFLTIEQFFELEHNGELIENGVYEGNCYGTPKPSNNWYSEVESKYIKDSSVENLNLTLSGLHPSSEGKRKRNRSNVEAMASKNISSDFNVENSLNENSAELYSTSPPNYFTHSESKIYNLEDTNDNLGPLPAKWEKAYTDKGEVYFIDHNSSTSHWLDPRLSRIQKKSLEDCSEDELPYGWERIDDPLYGTYYIDHVNRQTQYENPVIQAKCNRNNTLLGSSVNDDDNVTANDEKPPYIFTSDPKNLVGERIRSTIIKSYKGLGFTIVGGGDSKDEFLQIKSIVKNGPAWCEGKLQTGDVLVYMNNKCVLGYTHQDMVNLFQSIAPGETVELEVCRGYPLPFDPNDPNTEVVTTVAVGGNRDSEDNVFTEKDVYLEKEFLGTDTNNLTTNSVKSVHDMYSSEKVLNITRPTSSTDFAINNNEDVKPEFLTMSIVKGAMGFGFTIADSAYGQKVKKILDKPRCKMLMEGDVLVEINHICVRNICHSEVVQVLKDCPKNLEATITVERINYGLSNNNGNNSSAGVDSVNITNGGGVDKSVVGIIRGNNNDNNNNGTDAGHQFGKELDQSRMKKTLDNALNFRSKTPTTGSNAIDYNNGYEQKLPPPPFVSTPPDGILTRSKTPVNNFAGFSAYHQQQLQSMALRNENELDGARNCYSRGECVVGNDLNLTEQKNDHAPACTSANMMWYHQRNKVPHEPRYVVGSSLESASASVKNYYNTANNSNNGDPPYGSNVDAIKSREDFTYANSVVSGSLNKSCYSQNSNSGLDRSSFDDFYNGDLSENYYCSPPVPPSSASSVISHKNNNQSSAVFEDVPPLPNSAEIMRMYSKPNDSMDVVNYEPEYVDSIVTIFRQAAGFGFRIVGGTEEGSQVSIGHIVEGGAAEQDGRLQSGDEIISVDNQCVMNSSHHHVVQLMGKAAINGKVTLRIRRKITSGKKCDGTLPTNVNAAVTSGRTLTTITSPGSTGGPVGNLDLRYPYDVVVRRGENEGFGFVIISSLNKVGSTIGRILEGSPAARCGQLRLGDQIIAVNHVNILNFHHGDIVNLIKDSGYAVTLTIGPPPLDDSSSTASIPLSHKEDESEEGQYYEVQVSRGSRGFGFSIRGGKEFQNMNLYVLQIAENGPAAASGRLKVGDRLIEINGISTKHMTHAQAIEVIRNCGPTVHLLVQRGGKVPPLPAEEQMICSSLSPGSAASINYGNNNDNR